MRLKVIIKIFLLCGLAAGCAAPAASITPVNSTITVVPSTPPIVSATVIHRPTNTETQQPSATTESTQARSITPSPSSTWTPTPTIARTSTALVEAIMTGSPVRTLAEYPSPDGLWHAEIDAYDCTHVATDVPEEYAFETLQVIRIEDGTSWTADTQLIACGGIGAYGLNGLAWSADSQYFYFNEAREGIPDGDGAGWTPPVFRFDITTSTSEMLGPGSHYANHLLAYILTRCPHQSTCETSLVLVDLETGTEQILLDYQQPLLTGLRWDSESRLILVDENGEEYIFNLETGVLDP